MLQCWWRRSTRALAAVVFATSSCCPNMHLQAVVLYYWRRAARIAPAHWAALVVTYVFILRGRNAITVP